MQVKLLNRGVKSREITLPAPIKGLNKKDPLSAMEPLYAIEMDNYIPLDGNPMHPVSHHRSPVQEVSP